MIKTMIKIEVFNAKIHFPLLTLVGSDCTAAFKFRWFFRWLNMNFSRCTCCIFSSEHSDVSDVHRAVLSAVPITQVWFYSALQHCNLVQCLFHLGGFSVAHGIYFILGVFFLLILNCANGSQLPRACVTGGKGKWVQHLLTVSSLLWVHGVVSARYCKQSSKSSSLSLE